MRIGYACINLTLPCKAGKTFRLKSYSEERLIETVANNLSCLRSILEFNVREGILFFRITSDLVPFASHPICTFEWQSFFQSLFSDLGNAVRSWNIRVDMHPDQFTLINSPDPLIFERSVRELRYHAEVLDLMGLDETCKIQIHVGGIYGDKRAGMNRFVDRYQALEPAIKRRLVVENDEKLFTSADCLLLHESTGIPVVLDTLHHSLNANEEGLIDVLARVAGTWGGLHGLPIVDYSIQEPAKRRGRHAESLDETQFRTFLEETTGKDFDVMLEIKDKERSAIKALKIASKDPRLIGKQGGG